jgi:Response regulator containing a CheY-like receiver domain and an HTH DNA-binding domain
VSEFGCRVVLVDDHALFRSGLALLLSQDDRICVVGEGASSDEAVVLAGELLPDVLLLDVEMDAISAETSIRRIARTAPTVKVIVLTMHRDNVLKRQLVSAGASGYVTKDAQGPELVEIILTAHRAMPLAKVRDVSGDENDGHATAILSDRELQVLRLVSQAQSNREIGTRLSISEGTVKRHTTNTYAKLGATSRIDAVRKASRLGLL